MSPVTEDTISLKKAWLRDLMESKKWNRQKVSDLIDKSTKTITRYTSEDEPYVPTDGDIVTLALAANVPIPEFVAVGLPSTEPQYDDSDLRVVDRRVNYQLVDTVVRKVTLRVTTTIEVAEGRTQEMGAGGLG